MSGTRSGIYRVVHESLAKEVMIGLHSIIIAELITGDIVYTSPLADKMFGYDSLELIGQSVDVLLDESVRERHASYRKEFAANPRARPASHGLVLFGRHKDGHLIPVQIALGLAEIPSVRLVIAFVIDLTEAINNAARIAKMVELPK